MWETVRSTSSMRSRFQPFRMSRKCWSCSLFMYASPRLVMYGVTLRGPASKLPASMVSSASLSAARGVALMPAADGTPVAVTTMRSDGGVLRMACATGVALALLLATGAGFAAGVGFAGAAALAGGAAFAGAGLVLLAAAAFGAGFLAVNFGFSTFFGFAG